MKEIKIKRPTHIEILALRYKIKYEKSHNGGSFSMPENQIIIGIKSIDIDPLYTLSVISHEIMEIILTSKGCRFQNQRTMDNYLFNFSHQEFENAIQLHTQAMINFIY